MATAGQLLTTGGTTTIAVVANASGQTLLVQPTTIVNTSPPRHTILKQVSVRYGEKTVIILRKLASLGQ